MRYLNYDPHTLSQNWADAMNLMTVNLRRTALTSMEKNNTVGTLEEEQSSSTFKLSHIEESKTEPLTYHSIRRPHRAHRSTTNMSRPVSLSRSITFGS